MKDRINNASIWRRAGDVIKDALWKMTMTLALLPCLANISLHAQQVIQTQIPTLQVCNDPTSAATSRPAVSGNEAFFISSRAGGGFTGNFNVYVNVWCDLDSGYPTGKLAIYDVNMNDSTVLGTIYATTIDQVTIAGIATPTAWLSGRCVIQGDSVDGQPLTGCRYWMMLANNAKPNAAGTPDVVSFLVFNNAGMRIAYGTAPANGGSLSIIPGP